jgi:hypothetical protein
MSGLSTNIPEFLDWTSRTKQIRTKCEKVKVKPLLGFLKLYHRSNLRPTHAIRCLYNRLVQLLSMYNPAKYIAHLHLCLFML